ncbi:phage major capsid protein [Pseudomonas sp.]|uniref:phage major capsid protein n=1 Tax=Pseudomonas sp. TaxID=306 RepID=UPI002BA5FD49|nr:phage major capsid protein [Pseudomonas sp.]HUE93582.1 phage major capsid protein [Pseudomonas sp.]
MQNAQHLVKALQYMAAADGKSSQAIAVATAKAGPESGPVKILKTWALTSGSISPELRSAYRELIALAERRSLLAQIRAVSPMRRVPFETDTLLQTGESQVGFIGEGGAYPVSSTTYENARLPGRKLGGIIPISDMLIKGYDFDFAVTGELTRAVAEAESQGFYSAVAGSSESPAGILHGVTPGTGSSNAANDVAALIDAFDGDLGSAVILTSPRAGVKLFAAGFESSGARGGDLAGIAHVAHRSVPDDEIAILDCSRILIADDNGLEIVSSQSAALGVLDSSGELVGELVSMFQTNTSAFRITRYVNWKPADGAVGYMTGATW